MDDREDLMYDAFAPRRGLWSRHGLIGCAARLLVVGIATWAVIFALAWAAKELLID